MKYLYKKCFLWQNKSQTGVTVRNLKENLDLWINENATPADEKTKIKKIIICRIKEVSAVVNVRYWPYKERIIDDRKFNL